MLSLLERMSTTGPFASARTDRLGRYEIADYIAAGLPFVLEAAHQGFLPVITQEAVVQPGDTATLEVRMRDRAVKLTGQVLDQDGTPVASAVVAQRAKAPSNPLRLADGREVPPRNSLFSLIAPARWACFRPQGMTATDGGFSFPTLPAGEVTVTIRHRGYRTCSETLDLHDEENHVKVFLTRE